MRAAPNPAATRNAVFRLPKARLGEACAAPRRRAANTIAAARAARSYDGTGFHSLGTPQGRSRLGALGRVDSQSSRARPGLAVLAPHLAGRGGLAGTDTERDLAQLRRRRRSLSRAIPLGRPAPATNLCCQAERLLSCCYGCSLSMRIARLMDA